jgi:hypothetical protein
MKTLSNNRELYDYLLFLSSAFKERGAVALSKAVTFAIGQAAAMSTEFLGESRIALRQVLKDENGVLTQQERDDLLQVVKQLDDALDGRRQA